MSKISRIFAKDTRTDAFDDSDATIRIDLSSIIRRIDAATQPNMEVMPCLQTLDERTLKLSHLFADQLTQTSRSEAKILSQFGNLSARQDRYEQNVIAQQKFIQQIEVKMQQFSESHFQGKFLRPLARQTIQAIKSFHDWLEDNGTIELLENQQIELLESFEIDLIRPESGDVFDPATMKPKHSIQTSNREHPVVSKVLMPGAKYKDTVLCFAEVELVFPDSPPKSQFSNVNLLG